MVLYLVWSATHPTTHNDNARMWQTMTEMCDGFSHCDVLVETIPRSSFLTHTLGFPDILHQTLTWRHTLSSSNTINALKLLRIRVWDQEHSRLQVAGSHTMSIWWQTPVAVKWHSQTGPWLTGEKLKWSQASGHTSDFPIVVSIVTLCGLFLCSYICVVQATSKKVQIMMSGGHCAVRKQQNKWNATPSMKNQQHTKRTITSPSWSLRTRKTQACEI